MVEFNVEEKEGALKVKKPVYGNAHSQFGLETRPSTHEVGAQLLDGVEYDRFNRVVLVVFEQNVSFTPDSVHIRFPCSL